MSRNHKDKQPEAPPESSLAEDLKEMGAVSVEDNVGADNASVKSESIPDTAGNPTLFAEAVPSCMNGCPHFQGVPEAGGKFLGYCRRYPPTSIARFHYQFAIINHPTLPGDPPICGEHPTFRPFA